MVVVDNLRETPKIVFLGLGICGLSLILNLAAFATPDWILLGFAKFGLWRLCTVTPGVSVCVSIFDSAVLESNGWFRAVQGMAVISLLSLMAGVGLLATVCLTNGPRRRTLYIAGVICCICSEVAGCIEMAIVTGKLPSAMYDKMFYLAWVSVGIQLPGVIVAGIGIKSVQSSL